MLPSGTRRSLPAKGASRFLPAKGATRFPRPVFLRQVVRDCRSTFRPYVVCQDDYATYPLAGRWSRSPAGRSKAVC
jgi:hypothetical protein